MASTRPSIVAVVVTDVKVKTERVPIEAHRSVKIADLEHDGDESTLFRHMDILTRIHGGNGTYALRIVTE